MALSSREIRMSLSYRWVIVAAGALMTCVAIGAMFSLAVFLEPMAPTPAGRAPAYRAP